MPKYGPAWDSKLIPSTKKASKLMKALAISGSPRKEGNTWQLLHLALEVLAGEGFDTEFISLHDKNVQPCIACGSCQKNKNQCAQEDDLQEILPKMHAADALLVGSPVYFGSATPNLMALLDRAGYIARYGDNYFNRKVGAPVVVARRAGVNFTYAQLLFLFHHHGHGGARLHLLAHRLRSQTGRCASRMPKG